MSLMNYSLPFTSPIGPTGPNWSALASGFQPAGANAVNGLIYDPAAHQPVHPPLAPEYYPNNPYAAPPLRQNNPQQSQFNNNHYLPPHPQQHQQQNSRPTTSTTKHTGYPHSTQPHPQFPQTTRTFGESSYGARQSENQEKTQYFNSRGRTPQTTPTQNNNNNRQATNNKQSKNSVPDRPGGYVKVQAGSGGKTQSVAVLDYDDDEEDDYYYDDDENDDRPQHPPNVTPIQGPIFLGNNGTVPVVPVVQNPALPNSSFVQIPIWWTALSVALGLNVRGDVIRGAPCIKRNHQLFCPQAGSQYPKDKIEAFIDDNKALMKRMYGDFEMNEDYGSVLSQSKKRKRNTRSNSGDAFEPDWAAEMSGPPGSGPDPIREAGPTGDSYFAKIKRNKRQSRQGGRNRGGGITGGTGRSDACESKVEIVTPYWASNSAGKIRAIVNTQHFEQAIHQEVCTNVQTNRCAGDCGCEQKYKWHRLLAYDPDNDCKGIFMDWFLFPSCCVCRCEKLP
ncbi:protein spaetzle 3 [Culicoides brevitarsis]|uniref:protein spaetzle 3 n=1 Tax=Culicoides brevitarsis TaxID=469753 RepID=UPI00307CBE76